MSLRLFYRSTFLCLCIGFIVLLAGCANGAAGEATVTQTPQATSAGMSAKQNQASTPIPPTPTTATSQSTGGVVTTTASPTPHPSPTSAPVLPSPTPRPADPGGKLTLALACSGPNAQDGFSVTKSSAHACVYTSPGADITISVDFCNNPDPSNAIRGTFVANTSGFYEWTWTPQAQQGCNPSSAWSVTVNASMSGQSASVSDASAMS